MTTTAPHAGSATEILQLKITLTHSRPLIWRRVLVAADCTLYKLNQIIQIAMGWTDSHLHRFEFAGKTYSLPDFELDEWGDETDDPVRNERRTRLNALNWKPKDKIRYEYDFGDSWSHEVLLEKIPPVDREARYPKCIGGKRACPPEDVGGIHGYVEFLEAIRDPDHDEHDSSLVWAGGSFDPEFFSKDAVNARLWKIFRK